MNLVVIIGNSPALIIIAILTVVLLVLILIMLGVAVYRRKQRPDVEKGVYKFNNPDISQSDIQMSIQRSIDNWNAQVGSTEDQLKGRKIVSEDGSMVSVYLLEDIVTGTDMGISKDGAIEFFQALKRNTVTMVSKEDIMCSFDLFVSFQKFKDDKNTASDSMWESLHIPELSTERCIQMKSVSSFKGKNLITFSELWDIYDSMRVWRRIGGDRMLSVKAYSKYLLASSLKNNDHQEMLDSYVRTGLNFVDFFYLNLSINCWGSFDQFTGQPLMVSFLSQLLSCAGVPRDECDIVSNAFRTITGKSQVMFSDFHILLLLFWLWKGSYVNKELSKNLGPVEHFGLINNSPDTTTTFNDFLLKTWNSVRKN